MRKCCCCISVHVGSVLLALLGIIMAGLELVAIVPYLLGSDGFNPIKKYSNDMFFQLDKILQEQNLSQEQEDAIMDGVRANFYPSVLTEGAFAAVFVLLCVLMMFGVQCRKRALMMPYLFVQLVLIIVFLVAGILVAVALFFTSVLMGTMWTGAFLVAAFIYIYCWNVVRRSYKELGNRDYMYSPAPVKPIYNPPEHKYQQSPQQFMME